MKNEVVINPMPAVPGRRFLLANIAAQGGGQAVTVVLSLVTLPIYAAILGAEGLGLIGFTVLLSALLCVFNMGMTSSVNRQIASLRGSGRSEAPAETGDLMRTFEMLLVGMAVVLAAMLSAGSPLIARFWLKSESFGGCPAWVIVVLIACMVSVRWVTGFYHACLLGMERQKLSSLLRVFEGLLLHLGAVCLLLFVSGEIVVYFIWMAISSAVALIASGVMAWRCSPGCFWASRFGWHHIQAAWRFAVGVGMVTIGSLAVTQIDRVIVSTMFDLEAFGYYTTALMVVAAVNGFIVTPVFNVVYPRFTVLLSGGLNEKLSEQYVFAGMVSQLVLLPIAVLCLTYGRELMFIWMNDATLAAEVGPLLGYLIFGAAAVALTVPAYALQLAAGWTSLSAQVMIIMAIIIAPIYWLVARPGDLVVVVLVTLTWQLVWPLILLPLTHRRLLRGVLPRLVRQAVVPPLVGAGLFAGLLSLVQFPTEDRFLMGLAFFAALLIGWGIALTCCAVMSSELRIGWRVFRKGIHGGLETE